MGIEPQFCPPDGCTPECPPQTYKKALEYISHGRLSNAHDQSTQAKLLYSPIDRNQTRLLVVQPGSLGSALIADLHVVWISSDLPLAVANSEVRLRYKALSYCWGGSHFPRTITCNDIVYPITESLYCALQRLRDTTYPKVLWVDAVCTNQHDLRERSLQVENMEKIFHKADKVFVWLGEHKVYSEAVVHYLDLQAYPCSETDGFDERRSAESLSIKQVAGSFNAREVVTVRLHEVCDSHKTILVQGLQDILSRPWFRRLWVVQEIWFSRDAEIRLGGDSFSWSNLEGLSGLLHSLFTGPGLTNYRPFQPVRSVPREPFLWTKQLEKDHASSWAYDDPLARLGPLRDYEYGNRGDLLHILQRTAAAECTDLRDHVYGILGMLGRRQKALMTRHLTERTKQAFTIDYTKSIAEVFADAAKFDLEEDLFALRFLLLDASFGGTVKGERLPSWCPNWSEKFRLGRYVMETWKTRDSTLPRKDVRDTSVLSTTWDVLRLNALQFGTVEKAFSRNSLSDEYPVLVHRGIKQSATVFEAMRLAVHGKPPSAHDILVIDPRCSEPLVLRHRPSPLNTVTYEFIGIIILSLEPKSDGLRQQLDDSVKEEKLEIFDVV